MTIDQITAEISKNAKGEYDAIEGYYNLINELKRSGISQDIIKDIEEIISDELNHAEKLTSFITRLTGIKPNIT